MLELIETPSDDLNTHYLVGREINNKIVTIVKKAISKSTGEVAYSKIEYNQTHRTYRVIADADDIKSLDISSAEALATSVDGTSIHIDIYNFLFSGEN